MTESFGARLRQQRERQQIPLAAIAAQTKIKPSLLEGLERDDVSHWPPGIFRRAYLRAYVQAIGLEPDVVVREFLELHPDPMEPVEPGAIIAARGGAAQTSAGPPTRLRYLVDSALGSLPLKRSRTVPVLPVDDEELVVVDAEPIQPAALTPAEPDLADAASWCTALGRVEQACEASSLLQEAARILDASGIIVWMWDAPASDLKPTLAYGYSDSTLAHIPAVGRDADNATAAAFRSAQMCTVAGNDRGPGALVVPMMTSAGCAGVLAVELRQGREHSEATRALATIFAAQLARVPAAVGSLETVTRRLA